jgi:hypothetical protein
MDWHDDVGGECDFLEGELKRLNQKDESEVALFCWAGLRSLNDGHIGPAVWLNAIGNIYAVTKQRAVPADWDRACRDRYGREHQVRYLKRPRDFPSAWQGEESPNGLIWDIDLDYFTQAKPVPDQRYRPKLSDHRIAALLDPHQGWVREVLCNLECVTIALEPEYTGGLTTSLHLFRQWEKALFANPLFTKRCSWKSLF